MALKRFNSRFEQSKESSCRAPSHRQSQLTVNLEWTEIKSSSNILNKRAHHATVIVNESMYLYGGYEAGGAGILSDFMCFNIETQKWKPLISEKSSIGSRHSHSLAAWGNKLYLFGGILNTFESSNKVFSFEIGTSTNWKQELCSGQIPPPLNSHKATVYNDEMIVFGGEQKEKYSEHMYSLDLKSNEWKQLFNVSQKGISPRSDFSMSFYQDKIFIFGGKKDEVKYNQLWQYCIQSKSFRKIQTNSSFQPHPRSGHSSCIFLDNLIIFGGTSGITHQRNDLIYFNIKNNSWHKHWPDEQSQLSHNKTTPESQVLSKSLKKSRSNSFTKKITCSSFAPNQKLTDTLKLQNSNVSSSPNKKYRKAMKQKNYYNENYPFYGDRQSLLGNKHKKNDLLVDLQRQTKQDNKNSNGMTTKGSNKMQLHLSQTFESLNNSMLAYVIQNGSRLEAPNGGLNDDKFVRQKSVRQPKPRDGHTCEVHGNQMLIFGGDRHHMSFNDVVLVNLEKVVNSDQKIVTKGEDQ